MYEIQYHDTAGIAGQLDLNFRIDVEGSRYILRAGKFIVNGVTYTLANDTWFEDFGTAIQGTLWSRDGSTVSLAALPEDVIAAGMTTDIRNRWYADHGQRIAMVFMTVEHHYDVKTKKTTSGTRFMVSRCIPPGEVPANTVAVTPTEAAVQAIQESVATKMAQERMHTLKANAATQQAISNKTWDQLDAQEKESLMRRMAEKLGFIQKP